MGAGSALGGVAREVRATEKDLCRVALGRATRRRHTHGSVPSSLLSLSALLPPPPPYSSDDRHLQLLAHVGRSPPLAAPLLGRRRHASRREADAAAARPQGDAPARARLQVGSHDIRPAPPLLELLRGRPGGLRAQRVRPAPPSLRDSRASRRWGRGGGHMDRRQVRRPGATRDGAAGAAARLPPIPGVRRPGLVAGRRLSGWRRAGRGWLRPGRCAGGVGAAGGPLAPGHVPLARARVAGDLRVRAATGWVGGAGRGEGTARLDLAAQLDLAARLRRRVPLHSRTARIEARHRG
mmetsp:Transcript_9438/g.27765  ORF Transcript_9438/g.27765 Transcript_9438/m.27765 type:complete len:295 (+) Transcript_9438:871-1755(+)